MPALQPAGKSMVVPHDPDDPAIWVSTLDPARSLIFTTDKQEGEGGLYAFALDGTLRQRIAPLDRPNNVDVEYGFAIAGDFVDIVVLTERLKRRLRVFGISAADGTLTDLAPDGLPVLEGQAGESGEPMGMALYKRARDGALFAIVSPKTGPRQGYLWQYRLSADAGRVTAALVRRFGSFSAIGPAADEAGEIEAIVVDDALGYVYYSDERFGIRKWHADPDREGADRELSVFGREGYNGDREGLAIYTRNDGTGYLVSSDQIEGASRLHVYRREGEPGDPHQHDRVVVLDTAADDTDGIDVTSASLPGFPGGLLVMMNSGARDFLFYRWNDVAGAMQREASLTDPPSARR